jgi:ATP-dependent DNA helicase DinG
VDEVQVATLPHGEPELQRRVDRLDTAIKALRLAAPRQEGRHQLDELMPDMREAFDGLSAALGDMAQGLESLSAGSADIAKLHEQLLGIGERLALLASEDSWDGLRWLEVNPRSIRINLTPLDVSSTLSGLTGNRHQAWIFTSATLAVGDDFSHFTSRMGLGAVTGLTFPSPYALAENGLVYLPPGLPQPSDPGHTDAVMEAVTPLLDLTRGGLFCLFTSHRALNAAKKWFRSRCHRQAAIRVARGPAYDGAPGIYSPRRRQRIRRTPAAAGRAGDETGRGPAASR